MLFASPLPRPLDMPKVWKASMSGAVLFSLPLLESAAVSGRKDVLCCYGDLTRRAATLSKINSKGLAGQEEESSVVKRHYLLCLSLWAAPRAEASLL